MLGGPWDMYLAFMGSFFITFAISLIQAAAGDMWIIILGFFMVFCHSKYNGLQIGNTPAFVSMFKGMTGGEGLSLVDYGITTGLQFGGAFLGSMVFVLIAGTASGPLTTPLVNTGRLFIFFLFANMFGAAAWWNTDAKDTSLQGCFNVAVGYMFTWGLCQFTFPGSVGGFTIDFARMLVSKLFENEAYTGLIDNFAKFWIVIAGAFAGMVAGAGMSMVEDQLRAKQGGDDTEAAAGDA